MKKNYFLSFIIVSLGLFSCKKTDTTNQENPLPTYKVVQADKTNTTLLAEYPVTLEGVIDIEIRAKVDGYIEKIFVYEGQKVRQGQTLFKLETESVSQDAAAAKAKVNAAQVEVNRLKPLVDRKIISDVQLETAKANLVNAKSRYKSILAKINYATIKSPVNGIIGTLPLRLGSYVSSQTAESLTRVSDVSSVFAVFSVNEKEQLDIMMHTDGKTFQDKVNKMMLVSLVLSNGMVYKQKGKIETFSGQANIQTGSFNVRAKFPNPNRFLRSGGSGTIQIPTELKDVILIPQNATIELQGKRIALIVDKDNKIKFVPIETRPVPGGKFFVVDKGLTTKDTFLAEGVGIITEGTEIKPEVIDLKQLDNPKD
jgi:membrane fusion protein (multidrug efflux system)